MAHPAAQQWNSSLAPLDALNTTMMDSMRAPPGLERQDHLDLATPPGLECWRLAPSHGTCAMHPSVATTIQRMGVEQEFLHLMQLRNERLRLEHNALAEEHVRLREAFVARVPQAAPQLVAKDDLVDFAKSLSTPINVHPLKPPGVFEATMGSSSCASTAASEEAEEPTSCHPSAVAKLGEDVSRELRVQRLDMDGHLNVHWPVDARKLRGKDKQIISPSFEIFPGCSFKLMVKPRAMGDKKGQASFHKGRGCGSVELKLVEGVVLAPTLRFRIAVGGTNACRMVSHDFSNSTVCGSDRGEGHFDFKSAVDRKSSTFLVSLEVFPSNCMTTDPLEE